MIKIISLTLLATIILGIVDGLFFLVAEETLQTKVMQLSFFDETSAELFTGGVSTATAIFIASYIEHMIKQRTNILDDPVIDALGVFTGSIIVILLWKLFVLIRKRVRKENFKCTSCKEEASPQL